MSRAIFDGLVGRLDDAQEARHGRDLGVVGHFLGFDLVAHRLNGLRVRADENDTFGFQHLGKACPLGQKAIARMDGLGAGLLAGGDDLLGDQIGLGSRRRAQMDGLVRHLHMQRVLVGIRIDRDRLDAHLPAGLDDPACDFAAIGNQNFVEHSRPASSKVKKFQAFYGFAAPHAIQSMD